MNKKLTEILARLALTDPQKTTENILKVYELKGSCIVHFLYFASIILTGLDNDKNTPKKEDYKKALLNGDFLLPDGIALKLLYKKHFRKELPNLNGTDFLPYFLSHIGKNIPVEIILYGGKEEVAQKSAIYVKENFWHSLLSIQNGFDDFDWNRINKKEDSTIRILLVWRGSPLQEIWTEKNRQKIKEMECLTFTVGGLLDFWAGIEKRAPKLVRYMKIEWLYRALSNPKKNLKKTLVSLQLLKFLIR